MTLLIPPVVLLDHQDPPAISQSYIQKESLSFKEEDRLYEEYEARINAEWEALRKEEAEERMYTDHRAFYGELHEDDEAGRELQAQAELRKDYYESVRIY